MLWFFQGSVLQDSVGEVLGGGRLTRIRNEGNRAKKKEREDDGGGKGLRDSAASFPPAASGICSHLLNLFSAYNYCAILFCSFVRGPWHHLSKCFHLSWRRRSCDLGVPPVSEHLFLSDSDFLNPINTWLRQAEEAVASSPSCCAALLPTTSGTIPDPDSPHEG